VCTTITVSNAASESQSITEEETQLPQTTEPKKGLSSPQEAVRRELAASRARTARQASLRSASRSRGKSSPGRFEIGWDDEKENIPPQDNRFEELE
jgi:hypothetical protein